ncbi:MAG TPA: hypothetical protein VM261_12215 [Kofleriaceae bacterium]|nr:hypothetical protein [Kofleriaceae bacterium]
MKRVVALAAVIAGCATSPAPATAPAITNTPPPTTPTAQAPCAAVEGEEVEGFDLDGDGDVDRMTRSDDDMFGNTEFVLWRVGDGCPERLGSIEAWQFDEPRCAEPPTGGAVCRMTANRRMMHDDYQEYFWVLGEGGFVDAGAGRYIPGPDSKSP